MPLNVHVDAERRMISVAGEGVVTDQDLLDYVQKYLKDRDLSEYDEFFDLADADLWDLTSKGLTIVASAAAETDPHSTPTKIAILVSQAYGMGLSRMYQSFRENKGGVRETRIFWDREECLEWLDLPL